MCVSLTRIRFINTDGSISVNDLTNSQVSRTLHANGYNREISKAFYDKKEITLADGRKAVFVRDDI